MSLMSNLGDAFRWQLQNIGQQDAQRRALELAMMQAGFVRGGAAHAPSAPSSAAVKAMRGAQGGGGLPSPAATNLSQALSRRGGGINFGANMAPYMGQSGGGNPLLAQPPAPAPAPSLAPQERPYMPQRNDLLVPSEGIMGSARTTPARLPQLGNAMMAQRAALAGQATAQPQPSGPPPAPMQGPGPMLGSDPGPRPGPPPAPMPGPGPSAPRFDLSGGEPVNMSDEEMKDVARELIELIIHPVTGDPLGVSVKPEHRAALGFDKTPAGGVPGVADLSDPRIASLAQALLKRRW